MDVYRSPIIVSESLHLVCETIALNKDVVLRCPCRCLIARVTVCSYSYSSALSCPYGRQETTVSNRKRQQPVSALCGAVEGINLAFYDGSVSEASISVR